MHCFKPPSLLRPPQENNRCVSLRTRPPLCLASSGMSLPQQTPLAQGKGKHGGALSTTQDSQPTLLRSHTAQHARWPLREQRQVTSVLLVTSTGLPGHGRGETGPADSSGGCRRTQEALFICPVS